MSTKYQINEFDTSALAVPELLGKMAMERMLAGVSTQRYPAALEPVGQHVTEEPRSTSGSAGSRKFVAMAKHPLALVEGSTENTTPTPHWKPRRCWKRWPRSWTRPIPAPSAACAKAWLRR